MSPIAEHLAELTAFRDRDVLDGTLATALRDLLRPEGVAIVRAVGEEGRQRWFTRARIGPDDGMAGADPLWTELEDLPELAALPEHARCLAGEGAIEAEADGCAITLFPIHAEHDVLGVLEVKTREPLGADQLRLVSSVLRIYRNFQALLDYSERDTLTGLLNRKTFDECFMRVAQAGARAAAVEADVERAGAARRQAPPLTACLGVIDIDHFKRVNDTHGHLIGDEVLLLVSRLMRSSFRHHDQLFRFGGEEFVVLMRCAGPADAGIAFERLRANVERYAFPRVERITVSVGYTELRPGDTPTGCFERADKAVYFAKQQGRNQVHDHDRLLATGQLQDESHTGDMELS
jgi:diguanylate cyclase (GGDEF)-like protein